jgi:hypothetical protein
MGASLFAFLGRAAGAAGTRSALNMAQRRAAYLAGEIGLIAAATGGSTVAFVAEAATVAVVSGALIHASEKNGTITDEIVQGAIIGAAVGAVRGAITGGVVGAATGAVIGAVEGAAEGAAVGVYKEGGVVFGEEASKSASDQRSTAISFISSKISNKEKGDVAPDKDDLYEQYKAQEGKNALSQSDFDSIYAFMIASKGLSSPDSLMGKLKTEAQSLERKALAEIRDSYNEFKGLFS